MNRTLHLAALLAATAFSAAAASVPLQQPDVFVAGEGGYHTYRIPALIVASNQTLLAFCEGRKDSRSDTGDIDLLLRRSADGGKTWSEPQVVWDDGPNTCGNPCPVVDDTTGTIWLLLTHNPGATGEAKIKDRKAGGTRTVWVSRSEDNGKTWTPPADVTASTKDPSWGWYATGPGVGIQIQHGPHRGRLVIPCDHSFEGGDRAGIGPAVEDGSHIIYSDDHGQTWPVSRTLHKGPCAYSCLTVLPDKLIGCLYECGQTNAYERISFARFSLEWLEGTK